MTFPFNASLFLNIDRAPNSHSNEHDAKFRLVSLFPQSTTPSKRHPNATMTHKEGRHFHATLSSHMIQPTHSISGRGAAKFATKAMTLSLSKAKWVGS